MLCRLMVYSGGGIVSNDGGDDSDTDSNVDGSDWLSKSTNSVLDLLSDSYSNFDVFLYNVMNLNL